MALPARKEWPEGAEEALRKARRARNAKKVAALLGDVLILAALAVAYLWALDCRSKALSKLERMRERAARLDRICRELRAEVAILSSPASLREAANEAGLRMPEEGEVDFLIVLPLSSPRGAPRPRGERPPAFPGGRKGNGPQGEEGWRN